MDIIYDNRFNVSINIMEIINTLDKEVKLDLIESLLDGCNTNEQFDIITNVVSNCLDMEDRFELAKEVIGWLNNMKRQEIINHINKLLKKQHKCAKNYQQKRNEGDN